MDSTLAIDERFHPTDGTDDWAETSWWGFADGQQNLCGWIYLVTRPHLGVMSVGIWLHNSLALVPWKQPFYRQFFNVRIPEGEFGNLDNLSLANGLRLVCHEPFERHTITYKEEGLIDLQLDFRAQLPMRMLGGRPGSLQGHLDQALWAEGSITLGETRYTVNAPAARDRSWSPRGETRSSGHSRKDAYIWGGSAESSFQVALLLNPDNNDLLFAFGHVQIGPEAHAITSAYRRVTRRNAEGWAEAIELDLRDQNGKLVRVTGQVRSVMAVMRFPGLITFSTMVEWRVGGEVLWGEEQESWPLEQVPSTRDSNSPGNDDWMNAPKV